MSNYLTFGHTFVDLGRPAKLAITGKITIMAWAHVPADREITQGYFAVVDHGPTPSGANFGDIFLGIYNGYYTISSQSSWVAMPMIPVPPDDRGAWVHLCGVYDGTNWILYRNGQEVARLAEPHGAFAIDSGWTIGAGTPGTGRFWGDAISRVSIWNVALDADTIYRYAQSGDTPIGNEPGIAGLWPLDEGSGLVAHDRAATPADGAIATWTQGTPVPGWILSTPQLPPPGAPDYPAMVTFRNRLWILGGDTANSHAWWTDDGVKWTHVTPPWPPRRECAAFVCADRMFVIGGYNVKAPMGQCLGDIWSTGDADGRNWDRWQDVPWGPRSQQSAVVTEDNTIYILGGYEVRANVSYNDVWIGENGGLTWRRLIEHAPWEPRGYAATAWFNQGVWLFGGFRSNTLGDAWYWQPGRGDWAPVTAPTGPRFDAKAFVLNGKLYMVGGNANPGVGASDILCTGDLSHWTTISGGARWGGRLQAGIGPFKSRIYVAGGVAPTGTPLTDVWSYTVRDAGQPGGVFAGV